MPLLSDFLRSHYQRANTANAIALQNQAELAQIEARKRASIAEDQARQEMANRMAGDLANRQQISEMHQKMLQKEDLAKELVSQGMSPAEAGPESGMLQSSLNVAGPMAARTSALRQSAFNTGALALDPTLGRMATQAAITGNVANERENLNRFNVASDTSALAPAAANAALQQQIAGAGAGTTAAELQRQYAPGLAKEQTGADVAGLKYKRRLLEGTDPNIAAQAENAEAGGKAAQGLLLQRTQGIPVQPLPLVNPMMIDQTSPIIQKITSGIVGGSNAPIANPYPGGNTPGSSLAPGGAATPGVQPKLNLNMLKPRPTSAVDPATQAYADAIRKYFQTNSLAPR